MAKSLCRWNSSTPLMRHHKGQIRDLWSKRPGQHGDGFPSGVRNLRYSLLFGLRGCVEILLGVALVLGAFARAGKADSMALI
jgi:hypothetical protein